MKKRILLFIGLTVLMSIFGTSCYNLGRQITIEKTIPYHDGVEKIIVDSTVGDVFIIPENRDDVYVVFQTYENGQTLSVNGGATIEVRTKMPFSFFNLWGSLNYALYVHIPDDFEGDMQLELTSGQLELYDFDLAELDIQLTSGDINIYSINADYIRFDATSGDIQGSSILATEVDLEMTSGDVDLNGLVCEDLYFDMTSGKVQLDNFEGAIKGGMTSGDMDVHYANKMDDFVFDITSGELLLDYSNVDIDATFDIEATSGSIKVKFDLDKVSRLDEDVLVGSIGDGTYEVRVDLTSGDVLVTD
jgi:lia operon protein LiaG